MKSVNARVSNGAEEGMNNNIKSISNRSFGVRSAANFIVAIFNRCGRLALPAQR
jgi:transposase